MATVSEKLLSAEEYLEVAAEDERPTELVRGRIIDITPPFFPHGRTCSRVDRLIGGYVEERGLGHVVCNDSGVVTERNPDTVRGADFAFYSYARLPKEPVPQRYPSVAPDLVIEVRSPNDRWGQILAKVAEYLEAGAGVVCVLDPQTETARVFRPDGDIAILAGDQELAFPDVLGELRVPLRRLFE